MVSQTKKVTIIISRRGDRYFYGRQITGEEAVERTITRDEARNIVRDNPNGRITDGRIDFSELTSLGWTWTVEYGFKETG